MDRESTRQEPEGKPLNAATVNIAAESNCATMLLILILFTMAIVVIGGGVTILAFKRLQRVREGFGRKGGPFMQQNGWQAVGASNGGAYDGLDFSGKDRLADQEDMEIPFLPYPNGIGEGLGSIDPFALNQYRPDCCPGPMSSSTGCICLSSSQKKMLRTGGGVPNLTRPI